MCHKKYALDLVSEIALEGNIPISTPLEFNLKLTSTNYDNHIGNNDTGHETPLDDYGK